MMVDELGIRMSALSKKLARLLLFDEEGFTITLLGVFEDAKSLRPGVRTSTLLRLTIQNYFVPLPGNDAPKENYLPVIRILIDPVEAPFDEPEIFIHFAVT